MLSNFTKALYLLSLGHHLLGHYTYWELGPHLLGQICIETYFLMLGNYLLGHCLLRIGTQYSDPVCWDNYLLGNHISISIGYCFGRLGHFMSIGTSIGTLSKPIRTLYLLSHYVYWETIYWDMIY